MSEKLGLVGRKIGMTRIFTEDGVSIPVTVLEVSNNRITQVKTVETDGYNAVQVAFGSKKPSRVSLLKASLKKLVSKQVPCSKNSMLKKTRSAR